MRRRFSFRTYWLLLGAPLLVLTQAGPALAPHVAQLQVTPTHVSPGQEVTVYGPRGYGATNPVEIRLDSPTGPVLGSFRPDTNRFAQWGPGTIVIPEDTKPGPHVLWATQELPDSDSHIRGIPARAVIEVSGPAGTPLVGAPKGAPSQEGRPEVLLTGESEPGWGGILLAGLGAGGLALLVAGVAVSFSRRSSGRGAQAAPVRVTRQDGGR